MQDETFALQIGQTYQVIDIHKRDSYYSDRSTFIGKEGIVIYIGTVPFLNLKDWNMVEMYIRGDYKTRLFALVKLRKVDEIQDNEDTTIFEHSIKSKS